MMWKMFSTILRGDRGRDEKSAVACTINVLQLECMIVMTVACTIKLKL